MKSIIIDVPFLGDDHKYHYLYNIVNLINGKYYIGVHTTADLNDSYEGSGKRLHDAYKKYGIENFIKYIYKFVNSADELSYFESCIVDRHRLNDPYCYNLVEGGGSLESIGKTVVKNESGNITSVDVNDPRIGAELQHINTGKISVQDQYGNHFQVDKNDPRLKSGEIFGHNKGYVIVTDGQNNYRVKKDDPRYLSGELYSVVRNTVSIVDSDGNKYRVKKDDPRIKTGELKFHTSKRITVFDSKNNTLSVSVDDPRIKTGELKSVNKNRIYIRKDKINKMIFKDELESYLSSGWSKGMYKHGDITVHKDGQRKLIKIEEFELYEKLGWKRGQGQTRSKSGRPKKK